MEPLERLLNLVGLLLETRTAAHVRADPRDARALPSGEGRHRQAHVRARQGPPARLRRAARARRHRCLGRRAGVPDPQGRATTCPEIAFTPEELGALLVAAQSGGENTAAEAGRPQAALRGGRGRPGGPRRRAARVGLGRPERPRPRRGARGASNAPGRDSGTGPRRARRRSATVDAFAMVFRGGHWYLVGHDRERDDIRRVPSLAVHRRARGPRRGMPTPPEGFRAADHVQAGPWARHGEEQRRGRLRPRGRLVGDGLAAGRRPMADTRQDGWVEVAGPARGRGGARRRSSCSSGPTPRRSSPPVAASGDRRDAWRRRPCLIGGATAPKTERAPRHGCS